MRGTRAAGAGLVLVLAVACSPEPERSPGPAVGPDSTLPRLTEGLSAPRLQWGPCPSVPGGPSPDTPGLTCAELPVPLDYADPDGETIEIAVSRLSAGEDRPVLLSNPGGPGAPGLFNTLGVDGLTDGRLGEHYDLVGFDPRGVGLSAPVDCPVDDGTAAAVAGASAPTTVERDSATARSFAEACGSLDHALLSQLTTANTARDVEQLRKALGRERVSFYGNSYGTELALTYATVFPGGTGRVVLDGTSDLTVTAREAQSQGARAADARFTELATSMARRDRDWHLGSDAAAVRALYVRTAAELARTPVPFDGTAVDAAALQSARLVPALQDDAQLEPLALSLGFLAGVPGAPSERELAERLGDDGGELAAGQSLRQAVSAYYAIRCAEPGWQRDPAANRGDFERERQRWPVTRGQFSKIGPCAYWPVEPAEPRPALTSRGWSGGSNVLILQHTGDYRAPADGVRAVREALGSRAVLVSADDHRHGVLGRTACATDEAVRWLVEGVLPDADRTCPAS
ncbi:alpha/beta fold hydrolase [Prauserella cavernicola]|uniref:Alpha/beta fold hydrolase n=1 Tax=Prauserella cavernicola TaxID=2800127 RepID=A0A934V1N0_9PSEU|nr:alpha/beta fold hydrolase [Prauserella cavernicola]MBK1783551.1 alpha/beta fold hydrolase [Prauserella cavernicola]